ncbi:hypothetical protein HDU76_005459 [Blyttiomyces sp. JEL0837]|nr:hypothetical protein HDU76_005459 [Blyttiomyces sp. JEL0837]
MSNPDSACSPALLRVKIQSLTTSTSPNPILPNQISTSNLQPPNSTDDDDVVIISVTPSPTLSSSINQQQQTISPKIAKSAKVKRSSSAGPVSNHVSTLEGSETEIIDVDAILPNLESERLIKRAKPGNVERIHGDGDGYSNVGTGKNVTGDKNAVQRVYDESNMNRASVDMLRGNVNPDSVGYSYRNSVVGELRGRGHCVVGAGIDSLQSQNGQPQNNMGNIKNMQHMNNQYRSYNIGHVNDIHHQPHPPAQISSTIHRVHGVHEVHHPVPGVLPKVATSNLSTQPIPVHNNMRINQYQALAQLRHQGGVSTHADVGLLSVGSVQPAGPSSIQGSHLVPGFGSCGDGGGGGVKVGNGASQTYGYGITKGNQHGNIRQRQQQQQYQFTNNNNTNNQPPMLSLNRSQSCPSARPESQKPGSTLRLFDTPPLKESSTPSRTPRISSIPITQVLAKIILSRQHTNAPIPTISSLDDFMTVGYVDPRMEPQVLPEEHKVVYLRDKDGRSRVRGLLEVTAGNRGNDDICMIDYSEVLGGGVRGGADTDVLRTGVVSGEDPEYVLWVRRLVTETEAMYEFLNKRPG